MLLATRFFSLCLAWLVATGAGAAAFEDNMAQRTLACTGCHGQQGRAGPDGYYPRLAGKPAQYLFNQLRNFQDERRRYPLMAGLLAPLDEAYLHTLADYFANLSVPYPAPARSTASAQELERGRRLVQEGDAQHHIPACRQCHGLLLTGVAPATPGLLGLPADYINAQLGGWQTGQRRAGEPDCMARIARQLSASDSSAVARWLASQPVPANAHPAAREPDLPASATLPPCGSDSRLPSRPLETRPPDGGSSGNTEAAAAARGAYLAHVGNCAHCHTRPAGMAYAGGRALDTPFGAVLSSNLTPDPQHGIGRWSGEDFWHALHEGVSRDGHALSPAFPYTSFTWLTRADADDLLAYLRTLAPSPQPNQPHRLRWPFATQLALRAWRSLFFSPRTQEDQRANQVGQAGRGADWLRGQYLVQGLGHCLECHGARNALGARSSQPSAQGSVLAGEQWLAPSLHDLQGASVAMWSEAEVVGFLRSGRSRHGTALGPMAEVIQHGTQHLTLGDAQAMAVYLRSLVQLPGVPVQAGGSATGATTGPAASGAALYERHCADCHGLQGQGLPGAYPALAGNRHVTQVLPNNLINTVLAGGFGPSTPAHPRPYGMPPFTLLLKDAELAAVLSHVRSSWGNRAAPISEFDVNRFRRSRGP